MKKRIYFLCFFMIFLTACTHTVDKVTSSEHAETEVTSPERAETEDSSNDDFIDLDTDIKLDFTKDSKTSSLTFTLGMSYDDVKKSLASIGENIDKAPWDAYSNYTIIDKKEIWPELKTEDDYNRHASIEVFIRNEDLKYSFFFLSNSNTNILSSVQCDNSSIETNKHIKCGDSINKLVTQYGSTNFQFKNGKTINYEYKTNDGYLNFYIDPQSQLISQWGINLYSYDDYIESGNVLDRIFKSDVTSTEKSSSQTADEYKEDSEDEESSSFEQSVSNETESNSSVITQEEALEIVKNDLKPLIFEGDHISYELSETKEGKDYYVFRYTDNQETLAWFFVNQIDGSCYILDFVENDLIEYHPGDVYWSR